jgi:uncharacterized SAM-binding protein YcdF (DUF218 family)
MKNEQIKHAVNEISKFLAVRDIDKLDCKELKKSVGLKKVDVLVLLGNSIPYTIKCVVDAYENNLCDRILINGGIGHSTEILRNQIRKDERFNSIEVESRAEADIFFDIMTKIYNIPTDKIILENKSTNCGDNALKAITLLDQLNISYSSLLLIQDPTMQLRTYASFLKYTDNRKVKIINYSPFIPVIDNNLKLTNTDINGIWGELRYLELIMGEIPRLRDDNNGYGPCGKNYIAHVDMPKEIEAHYNTLKALFNDDNLYGRVNMVPNKKRERSE